VESRQGGIGYIAAIDGLRAIAVVSVMVFHLWPGALPGGFTGVDIFFVISGFVVTGSLVGRRFDGLGDLLRYFYARRLVRIMPALVLMLLVTILVSQLFVPDAWLSRSVSKVAESAFFGLSNVLLATDNDSYFGPQAAFNPFTHTWSLGVEEQFYLLFPFLLFWHQRVPGQGWRARGAVLPVAVLTGGSLAICAVLTLVSHKYAFYLIFARFWELGAGMLLCLTIEAWRPRIAALPTGRRNALIGASALAMVAGLIVPETGAFPFPLALLPVLGTAGIIALVCALPDLWVARLLRRSAPLLVGRLSYSLYLWHWPVFVLFRWTVGLAGLAEQLVALALAVALAALSFWCVEQPLRLNRRVALMPRGRVVAATGVVVALSAVVGALLFAGHDRLSLSVTRDHALWYADADRPLDPANSPCRAVDREEAIAGGTVHAWTAAGCGVRAGFAVYAIGDSHNFAYVPAYRQLTAERGVPVRAYSRAGCPFMKLNQPMDPDRHCEPYFRAVYADLRHRVRPGDVIFLPSLRLTRFVDQFGAVDYPGGMPADIVSPANLAEARGILADLSGTGARIVFEAPKPIYRAPPFRCADWFNRDHPDCAVGLTMKRAELERMRRPVLTAMRTLAQDLPAVSVWDPFPILCPADPCRALDGQGRPQVFDADHLSGHGNDLLYPSLSAALLAPPDRRSERPALVERSHIPARSHHGSYE
jgi:peptidoglycan/LPS O-acetylase OafA/YrhL